MMLFRTYVGPSPIQGNGVFADERMAKGTLIWRIDHRFDLLFPVGEMAAMPSALREFLDLYAYPHLHTPGYYLLNIDNSRFMNHSFAPNTDFRTFDCGYALRDIAAGEEITCDYTEFDSRFTGSFERKAS